MIRRRSGGIQYQSLVSVGCPAQAAREIAESAPKDSVREYVMGELMRLGYTEQANRYMSYWGGFDSKVLRILKERYLMRSTETPYEMFGRMADCIAKGGPSQRLYHDIMWSRRFLPNSPCFTLHISDDLPGIMDTIKEAALIRQSGGYITINHSALSPAGLAQFMESVSDLLVPPRTTNPCWGGETRVLTRSGPVPFRELAMGPSQVDVLSREEDGTLSYRTMQNPGITTQNAEVVALVLESETGECSALRCTPSHNVYVVHGTDLQKTEVQNLTPGMRLLSAYNDGDTTHQTLGVSAAAGDIPVKKMDGTGHPTPSILPLNLAARKGKAKKVKGRSEGFMTHEGGTPVPGNSNKTTLLKRLFNHRVLSVIRLGRTDVYNGTVDTTHNYFVQCGESDFILSGNCGESYPKGAINLSLYVTEHNTIDWERLDVDIGRCTRMLDIGAASIGLGVMGVADMLMQLDIRYNSAEAYKLFGSIAEHLSYYSIQESVCMAREDKPLLLSEGSLPFAGPDVPYHPWEHKAVLPWDDLKRHITQHGVRHTLTTAIIHTEIISMIAGCSPGIEPVTTDITRQIHWADQMMAHAAWQRWIGSPINKTITVQDLRAAYTLAHRLGCRGITIYKDDSQDTKMSRPSDVVAPYL